MTITMPRAKPVSIARRNRLKFRRTNELERAVRKIIVEYRKDRSRSLNRSELRKKATQLLVEIEQGASEISLRSLIGQGRE